MVAQEIGCEVVVTVTGPVQMGQPAQELRVSGGILPPTQHSVLSLRTPGQPLCARAEETRAAANKVAAIMEGIVAVAVSYFCSGMARWGFVLQKELSRERGLLARRYLYLCHVADPPGAGNLPSASRGMPDS